MEKIKTLYVRRLAFTVVLSVLGMAGLFAQKSDSAGKAEPNTNNVQEKIETIEYNLRSMDDRFKDEITGVKKEIEVLKDFFHKTTNETYEGLFGKGSKLQLFQMISAISEALIAVLLLGVVVVFLLKNIFHIIPGATGVKTNEAPGAESKDIISELTAEINSFKYKLDNIQSQLKRFSDSMDLQSGETSHIKENLSSFRTEMTDNNQKIKNMEAAISSLKNDIDKDKEKYTRKEEVERDPVAVYNKWAQNPGLPLPQYFTYVSISKLELRTKLEFTDVVFETDWIKNTVGEKKYFFPNPKKIDNLSGPVDKLYKVVGTRKGLGANSVKITNACQIKDGNYIEYQGELVLM
jgi:hypothetical protein